MDTTYYNLETKKVKVSGGADLLTFVAAPAASPAGEVLDFDRCRRKLETSAAWDGLAKAVAEVKTPLDEEARYEAVAAVPAKRTARRSRPARTGSWLELCASVSMILVCVCAGWAFLALA